MLMDVQCVSRRQLEKSADVAKVGRFWHEVERLGKECGGSPLGASWG